MGDRYGIKVSGRMFGSPIHSTLQFVQHLEKFGYDVTTSFDEALESSAEELAKIAKLHIAAQDFPTVALSPATVELKGHDNVFLDSGQYIESIKVDAGGRSFKRRFGRGSRSTAKFYTIAPDATPRAPRPSRFTNGSTSYRESAGLPMSLIVAWLEYGTSKQPARPFWGTTMLAEADKLLKSFKLKQRGGHGGTYYIDHLKSYIGGK